MDPRLVESDDGRDILTYTQWNGGVPRLAVPTSMDLNHLDETSAIAH